MSGNQYLKLKQKMLAIFVIQVIPGSLYVSLEASVFQRSSGKKILKTNTMYGFGQINRGEEIC